MKEASIAARITAVLILALIVAGQVEKGICFARNTEVPGASSVLSYVALFCLICYWLEIDSRERRVMRVWDIGFFMSFAWPIIVPYYIIRTRGLRRACLIFLLLAIIYSGAFEIAGALCRRTQ
jgi:hypothetical protein